MASGYYQQPSVVGNCVVFVAEGDVWSTTLEEDAADVDGEAVRRGSTPRRVSTCGGAQFPVLNHDGSVGGVPPAASSPSHLLDMHA